MHVYLKIKIKSLAAEARIIRREERKLKASSWYQRWKADEGLARGQLAGLQGHRRFDVRREARAAHLAYGFLRGRAYRVMEAKAHEGPSWDRVQKLAEKYAQEPLQVVRQRFAEWKDAAEQAAQAPQEPVGAQARVIGLPLPRTCETRSVGS